MGMPIGDITMLAEPEPVVEQLIEALEKRLNGESRWDGANKGRTADPDATYEMLNQGDNISVEAVTLCMNEVRKGRKITLTNVTIGWAADGYHFTHPLDYLGNDGGGGLAS